MGSVDSIPVVSQVKSLVQYAAGDKKAAKETQKRFVNTAPVVSQIKSLVQSVSGNQNAAKETQIKFGKSMGDFASGIPVVGHIKGGIEYALGYKTAGDNSMKAASRTVGVVVGAVSGFMVGGPPGAVIGAVSAGAAMDGIITGIDSAVHHKYRPYGEVASVTNMVYGHAHSGDYFDFVAGIGFDALIGTGVTQGMARPRSVSSSFKRGGKTRVYRVMNSKNVKKTAVAVTDTAVAEAQDALDNSKKNKAIRQQELDEKIQNMEYGMKNSKNRTYTQKEINDRIKIVKDKAAAITKKEEQNLQLLEVWITESAKLHSRYYLDEEAGRTHTIKMPIDSKWYDDMRKKCIDQEKSSNTNIDQVKNGDKPFNLTNDELVQNSGYINIGIRYGNLNEFNSYIRHLQMVDVNSWKYDNTFTLYIAEKGPYVGVIISSWSTRAHRSIAPISHNDNDDDNKTDINNKPISHVQTKMVVLNQNTNNNDNKIDDHHDSHQIVFEEKQELELIAKANDHGKHTLFYDQIPCGILGISNIQVKCNWKDQGSGTRKGIIFIRIYKKGNQSQFEDVPLTINPSPHDWELLEYKSNTMGDNKINIGDKIQFVAFIGGNHALYIKNFVAVINFRKSPKPQYVSIPNISWNTPDDKMTSMNNNKIKCYSKVERISIKGSWKDQGFGDRKGQIGIRIIKPNKTIRYEFKIFNNDNTWTASHDWSNIRKIIDNKKFLDSNIAIGDSIELTKRVGDGSGCKLFLKDFEMKIDYQPIITPRHSCITMHFQKFITWNENPNETEPINVVNDKQGITINYPVSSVSVSCLWKDQGSGKKTGKLYLQTISKKDSSVTNLIDVFGYAPHEWTFVHTKIYFDKINKFEPGDHFKLLRQVGSDNGKQKLFVDDLELFIITNELSYNHIVNAKAPPDDPTSTSDDPITVAGATPGDPTPSSDDAKAPLDHSSASSASTNQSTGKALKTWMETKGIWQSELYEELIANDIRDPDKLKFVTELQFDQIVRKVRVESFAQLKDQTARQKADSLLIKFEKIWRKISNIK